MLLFDMDGTLIDSNGVWKNVDREFLAPAGHCVHPRLLRGRSPYHPSPGRQVHQGVLPPHGVLRGDHCRVDGDGQGRLCPCHGEAGVRAYLKQCRAEGPPDGGGDLQRAGALPHRPEPTWT